MWMILYTYNVYKQEYFHTVIEKSYRPFQLFTSSLILWYHDAKDYYEAKLINEVELNVPTK